MATYYPSKSKNQQGLLAFFIGIIIVISLVVYKGFFQSQTAVISPELAATVVPKKTININFEVLEGDFLKSLELFPVIQPLGEGEVEGRENPFLPY